MESAIGRLAEEELVEMVRDVKGILHIPLAVKLSPFFTWRNVRPSTGAIVSPPPDAAL